MRPHGEAPGERRDLGRIGGSGRAGADPIGDAHEDHREPEQREDEMEAQERRRRHGMGIVMREKLGLRGNAESGPVKAEDALAHATARRSATQRQIDARRGLSGRGAELVSRILSFSP